MHFLPTHARYAGPARLCVGDSCAAPGCGLLKYCSFADVPADVAHLDRLCGHALACEVHVQTHILLDQRLASDLISKQVPQMPATSKSMGSKEPVKILVTDAGFHVHEAGRA